MFSVVIPCHQAPAYLDLCLKSALEGQAGDNEFIVVIDGCEPEYSEVLARWQGRIRQLILKRNEGLPQALNKGVWLTTRDRLLIVNEDNVFPAHWDTRLAQDWAEDRVLTINQIEPAPEGMYRFLSQDFGTRADTFDLPAFLAWEQQQARAELWPDGRIFPFCLSKRLYLAAGGFDPNYPSPHFCDLDFFLKLELRPDVRFARTLRLHFYHFGQKSTSNPDATPEAIAAATEHYRRLGESASALYRHKWGIAPQRGPDHTLLPEQRYFKGIHYLGRFEDIKLATIVNFCSNEIRFIDACLEQASRFSSQLVVPVCDHFFDGRPENLALVEEVIERHPEALFCGFSWNDTPRPPWYWPSLARVVALRHLDPDIEYVLFLDADEIVEGDRMLAWLRSGAQQPWQVLTLSNYWYFREPRYRALPQEDSALLIRRDRLREADLMDPMERYALLNAVSGPRTRSLPGLDGTPMVHHYSWVRSKEQMLRKVQSWSHREDRDWVAEVEAEFSHPFNGTDFVHGYTFEEVTPWLDI